MQGMRVYNDDIKKTYGIISATTSINSGSNADLSIIATDYIGNILWYYTYYAFSDSQKIMDWLVEMIFYAKTKYDCILV